MHFVSEDASLRAAAPRAHAIVGRITGERLINPRCLEDRQLLCRPKRRNVYNRNVSLDRYF